MTSQKFVVTAEEAVTRSLDRLNDWIEGEDFKGWDPHDALNSRLLSQIAGWNRLVGIAALQAMKRSPINLRRLLGVAKGYNPKGMGLFLSTYLRKFQITRTPSDLDRAHFFSEWLTQHASNGYRGLCWGYNFDWPNRGFFARQGTPTIVNTAFIGLSFLRYPELGIDARTCDPIAIARSACDFILNDLNRTSPRSDELCFSYTPFDARTVHNANVMGGCLLSAVYSHTKEEVLAEAALAVARYTVRRQNADGSWRYGDAQYDAWIDNFHTGFVLVALKNIGRHTGTTEFDNAVLAGYQFWKDRMLLPEGIPKYYVNSTYPIDAHSVAQAILTLISFSDKDPAALKLALRVADWAFQNMQDPGGYFHYQIRRFYRNRIPYMRWSQAWMQSALTELRWACRHQPGN